MEIFQDHLRVLLGDDARISKEEHEQALAGLQYVRQYRTFLFISHAYGTRARTMQDDVTYTTDTEERTIQRSSGRLSNEMVLQSR